MIQELQERVPLFGIGLGHELFAMANGVQVDRVPVEIHGMNHPIKEIITDHVVYANQGAGFQIQRESVNRENLFVTYVDMLTGQSRACATGVIRPFRSSSSRTGHQALMKPTRSLMNSWK